ncbi:MAG: sensor histidine kinase, partial [Verrucomicrobia bacterium]|nr:sensor histidine kinase [Verrucomicrobiota bacterium]
LERVLAGWDGQPLRRLHMLYHPEPLARLLADHDYDTVLFYGFGLAMIAFTFAGVSRWMIRPLGWLGQALKTGRAEPITRLRAQKNEFGPLADLVESSFRQRAALEHEVEERKNAEAALRRSTASLRNSMELRSRLARDLHDGVIQSIYAAGLGLESVRAALRSHDDASAEQRLSASQASLNRTIHEVRTFINGLEPEDARHPSLADSLGTLAATMQTLHPIKIDLELDPDIARSLSDLHQLHILQVVREAISNALRHGQASRIGVQLRPAAGYHSELLVTDDGNGFNPGERQGSGLGLENLATRAREMKAELQIESSPGKGTRLTLRFPSTNHPT